MWVESGAIGSRLDWCTFQINWMGKPIEGLSAESLFLSGLLAGTPGLINCLLMDSSDEDSDGQLQLHNILQFPRDDRQQSEVDIFGHTLSDMSSGDGGRD